jgi:hypothetical protein
VKPICYDAGDVMKFAREIAKEAAPDQAQAGR